MHWWKIVACIGSWEEKCHINQPLILMRLGTLQFWKKPNLIRRPANREGGSNINSEGIIFRFLGFIPQTPTLDKGCRRTTHVAHAAAASAHQGGASDAIADDTHLACLGAWDPDQSIRLVAPFDSPIRYRHRAINSAHSSHPAALQPPALLLALNALPLVPIPFPLKQRRGTSTGTVRESSYCTASSTLVVAAARDVEDGGRKGDGAAGERRRGGRDARWGVVVRGGPGPAAGDAAPRRAAGTLRGRHGRHAPRHADQRVRHRLLLRPRRIQVPGLRERPVRGLLPGLRVLHRRAAPGDAGPLLDRLPPRSGVHVPDPGGRRGVRRAALPGLQRRQGGDLERGVRRVRGILPAGPDVCGHHLRLRLMLHPAFPHLLLPPLQRLRRARAVARQQGRRDRRLPALSHDRGRTVLLAT